ncbi:MAG: methyltransferase family protein [Planctomycetota bacterium]
MGIASKLRRHPFEGAKVFCVAAFAAAYLWFAKPTALSLALGVPFVLAGVLIRAWAAGHLERSHRLTTSGPYAYLRDPLYLGRLLFLCGFGVMGNGPVTWGMFAAALLVFFFNYMPRKLRKETARLERLWGEPYREYRSQVRSLIPRLHPYPGRSPHRWRFQVFWGDNREQWLILAVLAWVTVLVAKLCV